MTASLTRRLWIIAAVLLLLQGSAFFFLQRAKSSEVRPLRKDLHGFPYDLGDWHGEDQDLDEAVVKKVGARHSISRSYRDAAFGRAVSLHIGDWDSLKTPTLPHPPTICYPAAGVQILRRETIEVDDADPFQAELLLVEREGGRSLVLYWYRWDEQICTTRTQACMARLKMIGSQEWPPVVKVLLDTPCIPSETAALESLRNFAAEVRKWTRDL